MIEANQLHVGWKNEIVLFVRVRMCEIVCEQIFLAGRQDDPSRA